MFLLLSTQTYTNLSLSLSLSSQPNSLYFLHCYIIHMFNAASSSSSSSMKESEGEKMDGPDHRSPSSSSSMRLLSFMVPAVIVVTAFASLQTPSWGSTWVLGVFHSSFPPPPYGNISSSRYSKNNNTDNATSPSNNNNKNMPDWAAEEDLQRTEDQLLLLHLHPDQRRAAGSVSDAVSNRSSSSPPPLLVPPSAQPHRTDVREERLGFNVPSPLAVALTNESRSVLMTSRVGRAHSKLERLEGGLRRARSAIRSRKRTEDRDYMPVGPMYWNANAFHRSYLEMEKQFKVFVYEEGEPPVFHDGPCNSIYSMEGTFIHEMELNSHFRTPDPDNAHAFFLPFSVAMLVHYVYVRDSHNFSPIKHTVSDYLDVLARKYPFWNRSQGADHFMLACHDWGPEASRSVPNLHKNAIRVLCNANTSEGFNPTKDVSLPETNFQTGGTSGLLGGPSPSRRPILAFFAGGLHGPIRPLLLRHWENRDEHIQVHQYLPGGISYYDTMRKSKYCICPSGYEVASPRIVEALYTGCVPVLISDHYVPPFSDILNWKAFSVEVSAGEIPNLKRILEGISQRRYIRLQMRGKQVRRHFEVNSPPKRFDAFHMILHSVWLRRLNVRVPDFEE